MNAKQPMSKDALRFLPFEGTLEVSFASMTRKRQENVKSSVKNGKSLLIRHSAAMATFHLEVGCEHVPGATKGYNSLTISLTSSSVS